MQPSRRRADVFGHRGRKCAEAGSSGFLDRFDACDIEAAALADITRGLLRTDALAGYGIGCSAFNLQPGLVLSLIAPDAIHLRVGVPTDHSLARLHLRPASMSKPARPRLARVPVL